MKKRIFALMLFSILAMLLVWPASAAQTNIERETALEISNLINAYRAQNGLYQYVYNTTLESVAQAHTEYQVSIQLSTHEGEGGSTSKERVTVSGYGGGDFIFADEMIYSGGFATPQAALDWWKNSPIHNGIMLSERYHEFGVGVRITEDKKYYTVNFASIEGVTSPGVGSMPVEPPQVIAPEEDPSQPDLPAVISEPPDAGSVIPQEPQPAVPEGYVLVPDLLLTVLVVVAVIASAGVTFFAFLRLRESGRREKW